MATQSGQTTKKRNIFVRIGSWFKAAALELRKVSWPKFGDVMKKLGIVLGVVLFFFFCLIIMDIVLTIGHGALLGKDGFWRFWVGGTASAAWDSVRPILGLAGL